jgi:hypothetical protein
MKQVYSIILKLLIKNTGLQKENGMQQYSIIKNEDH